MTPHRLSDRRFGLLIATALVILTGVVWAFSGNIIRWTLWTSGSLALTALVAPAVLLPLNRVWGQVAMRIGAVTNYIILGAILYAVLTPVGWILRLARDSMARKFDPTAETYLTPVERQSDPSTLKDWF
jgi:hypothetical protein